MPHSSTRIPRLPSTVVVASTRAVSAVRRITTTAGEVATVAHFGEYSAMDGAYAALDQWCSANGRRQAGVSWEVYGDWDDDPAKRRTDIYKLLSPG